MAAKKVCSTQTVTVSVSIAKPDRLAPNVWADTFRNTEFPLLKREFEENDTFDYDSATTTLQLAFQAWVMDRIEAVVGTAVVDYSAMLNHSDPQGGVWEEDTANWFAHPMYINEVVGEVTGAKPNQIYSYFRLSVPV